MRKIEREYRRLCAVEGFRLLSVESRRGHYALHFGCGYVIAPGTPSDCHYLLDVRAQMRRLHATPQSDVMCCRPGHRRINDVRR